LFPVGASLAFCLSRLFHPVAIRVLRVVVLAHPFSFFITSHRLLPVLPDAGLWLYPA
jgi:hypothetical protein